MNKALISVAALAAVAGTASAGAPISFQITEAFVGLSGEDGTSDWFEITNTGANSFDTGILFYDDSSPSLGSAGQLDSFVLATGESAVFLIDSDPADDVTYTTSIEEFLAIWALSAGDINLGLANGGGGLGQGGDEVNVGINDGGSLDVLATLVTEPGQSGLLQTIEQLTNGTTNNSVLGLNGAFESNPFFNDNLGLPNDTAILIGSPGVIPAPASAALLGLGGLAAARRRR
ncbi:MAG: hypothetical protein AAGG07_12610 [Planctomycetota bacterium]